MGYYTTISGAMRIEPPLRYGEFNGVGIKTDREADEYDLSLRTEIETTQTMEGRTERILATHLDAPESAAKYYDFVQDVQAVVMKFPNHRFIGFFEGVGEGNGQDRDDIWRVYVANGRVKVITPKISVIWPDTPDADKDD